MHPDRRRVRSAGMAPPRPSDPPHGERTLARTIRRRVMQRVADADDSHETVAAGSGEWQPFLDGIRIKVLHRDGAVLSYLLQLAPGATLPAHRHPHDEECVVLEGRLQIGTRLELGPGSYHLAHAGALHAPIGTPTGATIFLRGAVPDAAQILD